MSVKHQYIGKGTDSITAALVATTRQSRHTMSRVEIWLVWFRRGRIEHITRHKRLDLSPKITPTTDRVVVIGVAPYRVDSAVLGRIDVLGEFLQTSGVRVDVVSVPVLRDGVIWHSRPVSRKSGRIPDTGPQICTSPGYRLPRHRANHFKAV